MTAILRFRKLCFLVPSSCNSKTKPEPQRSDAKKNESGNSEKSEGNRKKKRMKRDVKEWRCIDSCCWMIGYMCTAWWLLLFLYHCVPANLPGLQGPEPPGVRLRRQGLTALHPVVLVPGIVTGGLELWEGRPCSHGLFRQRLWGGSFTEILKRPMCWLEHMSLDNETGLDPAGIRLRPVSGLVAADYFAPGYFVWAILIENLARIGYEEKNMYMAAYDWRLSFQNTELRDQSLSRLKSKIELMYVTNKHKKVVVVPHSMGANYFLHFMKWVEAPPPMGGGGGPGWCAKHIKSVMNIGPVFLGVPKAVGSLLSAESKDVAFLRAMAPGFLDSEILGLQALERVMRVSRTWDSLISLLPKGGEAIWGDSSWSPEEDHVCDSAMRKHQHWQKQQLEAQVNDTAGGRRFQVQESTDYGSIISFGKVHSSEMSRLGSQESLHRVNSSKFQASSRNVQTEYDEVSQETIRKIYDDRSYTANTLLDDLLRSVAPKMMRRAEAHFSHGIADNLSDPKYNHYKYWSNPLETKLPEAPDMEIYCLYGVGIPTERSYVYKLSPPVLSAGFMCGKGWRGKTRFNPSGIATYIREYKHKAPANLLEGRGVESGAHVDILGNVALIEDVMREAASESGVDLVPLHAIHFHRRGVGAGSSQLSHASSVKKHRRCFASNLILEKQFAYQ